MDLISNIVPSGLTILMLAPHPDDFDAVAVTMRELQQEDCSISVYVLTSGASGVEESFCVGDNEAKRKIRQEEQRTACRFFGLPDDALHFPDAEEDTGSQLLDNDHNLVLIEAIISAEHPAAVFLPHGNDANLDHRITYSLTIRALARLEYECELCLIYDPKTIEADVNAVTLFDEKRAQWKAEMLRLHASQHQRNLNTRGHGFDDRILMLNRRLAQELNLKSNYAEAFEVSTC